VFGLIDTVNKKHAVRESRRSFYSDEWRLGPATFAFMPPAAKRLPQQRTNAVQTKTRKRMTGKSRIAVIRAAYSYVPA